MEHSPRQRAFLHVSNALQIRTTSSMLSHPAHWKRVTSRRASAGQTLLLIFIVILLLGSFIVSHQQNTAFADTAIPKGYACRWYRVTEGDTLLALSYYYRVNTGMIARINHIYNANIIFTGQRLCIPQVVARYHYRHYRHNGVLLNGHVLWYAYNALDYSTHRQVVRLLRRAAVRNGLSYNLLLAIAWQESGWQQHVIARDGGIGTMQIMPYTAQGLNRMFHRHFDPYKLQDNIEMGALYLRTLKHNFHGNMFRIISAYNEGGWNVIHRGIFNWHYVNSVRALMHRF